MPSLGQQSRQRYAANGFAFVPIRAVFLDGIRLGCRNRPVKQRATGECSEPGRALR
jgi:hypothetical protein